MSNFRAKNLGNDIEILLLGKMKVQNNYRKLLESTETICKMGFWEYDLNSNAFWGSEGMKAMLGIDRSEFTPEDIKELQLFEFLDQINQLSGSQISFNRKHEIEFRIFNPKNNSSLDVHSIAEYDNFENKIFGIVQNISEKKIIENELIHVKEKAEESGRLKKSFLSNINHEIRTPMNGIVGFTQLLIQPGIEQETKEQYKDIIEHSCNQLLNVINDIIEISSIETEQVTLQNTQINISVFLNSTLKPFKSAAAKKNLSLQLNMESVRKSLNIISDITKLNKILSNLIDNAIRFTSEGYVEVGCLQSDTFIEFYVKDTGIGIPSLEHEIIFERFRQAENSVSQNAGGTGLGLAISKSYVTMLGGSIWVDSKPGEGSRFSFKIPLNAVNSIIQSESKAITSFNYNSKTCLVVDDIEMNYIYLKALLSSVGFNVLWAKDGDEAIYKSLNEPVDIVLMDLKMPNTNGYEATKIIKSRCPELPIIAQTACALLEEIELAFEAGCDDYLLKPINKTDFLRKVDLLLNVIT